MDRRNFFKISLLSGATLATTKTFMNEVQAFTPTCAPSYSISEYETSTGTFTHSELLDLARQYGTPLYVYDGNLIVEKYREFYQAFAKNYEKIKVHYAVKANTNLNILSLLHQAGADAECISEGEMRLAAKMGFKKNKMLFTSSSKSIKELEFATKNNVVINLDSLADLENLISVVEKLKKKVRVCFRINPDILANTHQHIATGYKLTKFGILQEEGEVLTAYKTAKNHPYLDPIGVHSHIGSQILDVKPFHDNVEIVSSVATKLKESLNLELQFIDLGGGLGIPYHDGEKSLTPEDLAASICPVIKEKFKSFKNLPELWLEPGRYFVAQAGILLAHVNSVKMTPYNNFVNVDTGFNHLARPLLYEAHHRVRVLNSATTSSNIPNSTADAMKVYQVAGNICETGDILAHERKLPLPKRGDTIAFLDTGAYGFSMSSEYNSFFLPAEVMRYNKKIYLLRKRASFQDLLRNQHIQNLSV